MRPNSPRLAMMALATTALLLPFSGPAALADSKDAANGAYAHGPLPPPAPVKDYSKNAATGDYAGWRGAAASSEPDSASPVQVVTAVKPGDFFDWGDAATGAGVGFILALVAGGATVGLARRRIASPATEGLEGLTRTGANKRRNP